MATVTKTFVEDYQSSYRSTWTVNVSQSDVTVSSSSFTFPVPTITAKYVYAGKKNAWVNTYAYVHKNGGTQWLLYGTWYRGTSPNDSTATLPTTSGTTYTLSTSEMTTPTQYTSNYFTSQNPTVRTIPISVTSASLSLYSQVNTGSTDSTINSYNGTSILWENVFNLVLDAPPTATIGTPTYSNPQYAGLGAYTVTVTTASARYGGNIDSITLTIGNQTDVKTFSSTTVTNQTFTITPSVAGTFTPTITITDSRGQTTVKSLPQITVNAYTAPNMSFDLARCDIDGIPQAEGEYGLVTANITYVDAIAELTQPTASVKDSNDSTIISSTTWYETWDAVNGVDDAVNWTNYNPTSPVTLYAIVSATGSEFSPNESYTVSITPTDNMGGVAQTITQTLATGFFTIDFQAGGKEIAFGAPANDDLTLHPNGLFKCNMDAWFNGDVHMQGGGGSGTSTPTADTTAQWDSNAHMNSDDMSAADIASFVSNLNMQPSPFVSYVNVVTKTVPNNTTVIAHSKTFESGTWLIITINKTLSGGSNTANLGQNRILKDGTLVYASKGQADTSIDIVNVYVLQNANNTEIAHELYQVTGNSQTQECTFLAIKLL